ncbi:MAG TPA: glycosyltransferase family 2 protein [Steroidobacteraceae bacterium]|nr:glycosyltransferase family 2 protein [Steroidobacteraceae bacterium]
MIPVSVLIVTKNEERNVSGCIDSVGKFDEVIVFDSHSTDQTVDLAKKKGATVIQRPFDNFAAHKNWALENISFRYPWVLLLDADERVTDELVAEIVATVKNPSEHVGFYVARKNLFGGRWIRHAGMYPDWNLRLLKLGSARFESRTVHEHVLLDGPAGFLKQPLVHHNDNKGLDQYIARHNTYSSMEAAELFKYLNSNDTSGQISESLFQSGPGRRRALKHFAYRRLPLLPVFVFLWMYIVRLGFLDGRIGLRYCILRSYYEYLVCLKLDELRTNKRALARS